MIGRIIVSELRRHAAQAPRRPAPAPPLPPVRPAAPPQRQFTGQILALIAGCAAVIALWIFIEAQTNHKNGTFADEETCAAVWQWVPGYEVGLSDEIGPASLTPDPVLRGDVARLLGAVQTARVVNAAIVPDPQIKADLNAVSARCSQMGLNPGGNDSNAIP